MPQFLNTAAPDFEACFAELLNAKREDSPDVDAVVAALDGLDCPRRREELGHAARQRAVQRHALGRLRAELRASYA